METEVTLPPTDYVTREELAKRLRVTPQTITNLVKRGRLPEPLRLSDRTLRWPLDAIQNLSGVKE